VPWSANLREISVQPHLMDDRRAIAMQVQRAMRTIGRPSSQREELSQRIIGGEHPHLAAAEAVGAQRIGARSEEAGSWPGAESFWDHVKGDNLAVYPRGSVSGVARCRGGEANHVSMIKRHEDSVPGRWWPCNGLLPRGSEHFGRELVEHITGEHISVGLGPDPRLYPTNFCGIRGPGKAYVSMIRKTAHTAILSGG
jgi:hypothetical protein